MQDSQSSQIQHLNSLHDKEVSALMKRLEGQNKEELMNLSKMHKDKNELARIKREIHQRLIDQAVVERQRFQSLLEKRILEMTDRHLEVKKKLEEEKKSMLQAKRKECDHKCEQLKLSYTRNSNLFVNMFLLNKKD